MNTTIAVVIAAVIVVGALILLASVTSKRVAEKKSDDWPVKAAPVMTGNELTLYWRLKDALPNHVVIPQLPLAAFIRVTTKKNPYAYFNRFDRLRADFAISDRGGRILAVVEVDGRSHDSPKQQQRDRTKSEVLTKAGIHLHRVNSKQLPEASEIPALMKL